MTFIISRRTIGIVPISRKERVILVYIIDKSRRVKAFLVAHILLEAKFLRQSETFRQALKVLSVGRRLIFQELGNLLNSLYFWERRNLSASNRARTSFFSNLIFNFVFKSLIASEISLHALVELSVAFREVVYITIIVR